MLPKSFQIFLLVSFFTILTVIFLPKSIFAATSWVFPSLEEQQASVDESFEGKMSGNVYPWFITNSLIMYSNCQVYGKELCAKNHIESFNNSGLIYLADNLVGSVYANPPASISIWLADTASNIGIVPKAYAQGIGFSALSPLLPLWKAMRNVSYALLIIILLAIGLMIMFRTKIDPKTVISVQTALPRIVITLILITFSYPIAGFMIDMMYVVLFLGISLIAPSTGVESSTLQATFLSGTGWALKLFSIIPGGLVIREGLGALGFIGLLFPPWGYLGPVISSIIGSLAAGVTKGQWGFSGSGIFLLLLGIVILFSIIRIFFMLINAYVQILINVIFAPILLLAQAVPGQNAFSSWIKNLLSNLVVFPATAILICVASAVSQTYRKSGLVSWSPPMLGFVGNEITETIVGIGFALVIPQIVTSIKKAFGAKAAIPMGGAVGRVVGQPLGLVQQAASTIGSFKLAFGKRA